MIYSDWSLINGFVSTKYINEGTTRLMGKWACNPPWRLKVVSAVGLAMVTL
jgi:hypothetical protein